MPLVSRLVVSANLQHTNPLDLSVVSAAVDKSYVTALQSGVGALQADKAFHDTRTLGPSASEDIDLVGATFTDPFGVALAFVKVKGIIVAAAAANANNVIVGGVAAGLAGVLVPAASATLVLRPGAVMALFAGQADATGYAVTATTADLLHIANSGAGTSVTYDVIVVGTSA
jgi:hypothetical protein